jgi:hypothetical protein
LDPTYIVIRILDKLKIVRLVEQKQVSFERVRKAA